MWILVIILIGVAVFGLIAGFFYNHSIQKKIERGELKEAPNKDRGRRMLRTA